METSQTTSCFRVMGHLGQVHRMTQRMIPNTAKSNICATRTHESYNCQFFLYVLRLLKKTKIFHFLVGFPLATMLKSMFWKNLKVLIWTLPFVWNVTENTCKKFGWKIILSMQEVAYLILQKSQVHGMATTWHWVLQGQRFTIYILPLPLSPNFYYGLVYDEPFPRSSNRHFSFALWP